MKKIKMLGLAAVAVLALSAFIGVASASATCVSSTSGTCTAFTGAIKGDLAKQAGATSEQAVLHSNSFGTNVVCTTGTEDTSEGSAFTGNVLTSGGSGNLTGLTFSNCKEQLFGTTCSATTDATTMSPWAATATTVAGQLWNGTLTVNSGVTTVSCPSLGITCKYTGNVTGQVYNPGNGNRPDKSTTDDASQGQVFFNGVTLTNAAGSACNDTATWTAVYSLTSSSGGNLWLL